MRSITMWGFGIILMRLADYFESRKYEKRMKCDVCGQKFGSIAETEEHRRNAHPDNPPRREETEA
jgi:hypothetical protein